MTTMSVTKVSAHFPTLEKVIAWAIDAAKKHVDTATTPDPETCMGLWQSFQRAFPEDSFPGTYDLAVYLYSTTYTTTVKALTAAPRAA
jgi:hypothetical protein